MSVTTRTTPIDLTHTEEVTDHAEIVIRAQGGWNLIDIREMWKFRELLFFLVWRDVKVRYKQTVLGALWAILQPTATMLVFTVFLGRLSSVAPEGVPYPLFVFTGLLPWTFFSTAVTSASQSVVGNQHLVTKVYFPRLFIPLGALGASVVDFAIASSMLFILLLYYGVVPSIALLLIPFVCFTLAFTALGVSAILSALTVAYRDFRHVIPFMVQLWLFATPIIYVNADAVISEKWQQIMPLNPVYGIIQAFRAICIAQPIPWAPFLLSSAVGLACLLLGCIYFRRVEGSFADII